MDVEGLLLGYHEIRVLIDALSMMMVFVLCIDAILDVQLCFLYTVLKRI